MKTLASIALAATLTCFAQSRTVNVPDATAEALVVCPELHTAAPQLTPYEFAKATLVSLWYARNAGDRSKEIKEAAKETDNMFSYVTAMMRINKMSTNDFICAKRSVHPFTVDKNDETTKTAAGFLTVVYDAHIVINQRLLDLIKNLDSTNQGELMDQISTLQVERGQRWADLVQPTGLALMLLVDLKRSDENGKATWLVITKAQKKTLVDWANEHFKEFKNGTPKDQWSDPAKTAEMFFTMLNGRKCTDE